MHQLNPLATQLREVYNEVVEEIGEFPHSTLVMKPKDPIARKSNIVKLVSKNNSEYTIKVKKDIIEGYGMPKDPEGDDMEYLEE